MVLASRWVDAALLSSLVPGSTEGRRGRGRGRDRDIYLGGGGRLRGEEGGAHANSFLDLAAH